MVSWSTKVKPFHPTGPAFDMLSRVLTKYPILKTGRAENGLKLSNGGVSVADWSVEDNLVGGSSKD